MDEHQSQRWWFSGGDRTPAVGSSTRPRERTEQPEPYSSPPGGAPAARGPQPGPEPDALPSISLPKGGGAIRGIDEKLTVDQPTGTARFTVPVFTSPGRGGFGPKLALSYDSGAGNGPYGLGWSLPIPSVTRKTSMGLPLYEDAVDSDAFLLGGDELVPVPGQVNPPPAGATGYTVRAYRPRVESAFSRIQRWENSTTGEVHWRTVSRDNVTSLYGRDATSQIADPDHPGRVFSWLLDLSFDDRGNAISYVYKAEDDVGTPNAASEVGRTVGANRYLKQVLYGNDTPYLPEVEGYTELPAQDGEWLFRLVLDYGEHDQTTPTPAEEGDWLCRPIRSRHTAPHLRFAPTGPAGGY